MGDPSRVRLTGPMEVYASGFAVELTRSGYTKNSTANQLRLVAHLSRWLATDGLGVGDLTPAVCDAFLAARRAAGYTLWLSRKALAPLLQYLRSIGAAPPEPGALLSPMEAMLARFRQYMTSQPGVCECQGENQQKRSREDPQKGSLEPSIPSGGPRGRAGAARRLGQASVVTS